MNIEDLAKKWIAENVGDIQHLPDCPWPPVPVDECPNDCAMIRAFVAGFRAGAKDTAYQCGEY